MPDTPRGCPLLVRRGHCGNPLSSRGAYRMCAWHAADGHRPHAARAEARRREWVALVTRALQPVRGPKLLPCRGQSLEACRLTPMATQCPSCGHLARCHPGPAPKPQRSSKRAKPLLTRGVLLIEATWNEPAPWSSMVVQPEAVAA